MGLTITSFPIMNGVASVSDVYAHIRDIKTTKQIIGINDDVIEHELEFLYYVKKNTQNLTVNLIKKTSTEPYVGNLWDLAYTVLKEELTGKNLQFVDVL
jgi:hypothetical protein